MPPLDFVDLCRGARERMSVPAIPLAAIRNAAECRPVPEYRKRPKGLITALLTGASIAAVAAGAEVLSVAHVLFNPSGTVQLSSDRLEHTENPTAEDLRSAARHAAFPVVLPAGLPAGTTPVMLLRAGSSALLVQYDLPGAWRRSNHVLDILLTSPQTLAASPENVRRNYELQLGGTAAHGGVHWTIGHEDVIVLQSTLTPAELAHLKSAMMTRARHPGATH